VRVTIVTNESGKIFCLNHGIDEENIIVWKAYAIDRCGVYVGSLSKVIASTLRGLSRFSGNYDVVFSASDFWPDIFPALLLKLRQPAVHWIAACYLVASSPLTRKRPPGALLRGLIVYLTQKFSLYLIRRYAGAVFTASEADRPTFYNERQLSPETVIAIRGGVDCRFIDSVPMPEPVYDALYVGRLHPQKCVDELLEIWARLLRVAPERKLAVVGNGPLEKRLREISERRGLSQKVHFLGTVDGYEKVRLLESSRVFVSASRFDSGNIALDEALACGIPGIVYDLPRLDYPAGVIKVRCGDAHGFGEAIVKLLGDGELYGRLSREARDFAKRLDWDLRAEWVLEFLKRVV
jgi:glycosyltransferase involved in cell wall biosynthesis